ncbi:hypothetical protein AVEN_31935-1 [Araneus ventricosus]|uniref:Secreted protein n=1 Tax=Araneus ventricosus TaxID=182803 RepID=A0A4Y2I343_ARAVE|nr:hypothetical protein AVEN_31935-1 [Araneus ventricosus]
MWKTVRIGVCMVLISTTCNIHTAKALQEVLELLPRLGHRPAVRVSTKCNEIDQIFLVSYLSTSEYHLQKLSLTGGAPACLDRGFPVSLGPSLSASWWQDGKGSNSDFLQEN